MAKCSLTSGFGAGIRLAWRGESERLLGIFVIEWLETFAIELLMSNIHARLMWDVPVALPTQVPRYSAVDGVIACLLRLHYPKPCESRPLRSSLRPGFYTLLHTIPPSC